MPSEADNRRLRREGIKNVVPSPMLKRETRRSRRQWKGHRRRISVSLSIALDLTDDLLDHGLGTMKLRALKQDVASNSRHTGGD